MDFRLYFRSRQGEMVHLLKQLTILESPTHDKKAVDACAAFVAREFKRIGCKVTTFPQKDIGDLTVAEFAPGRLKSADDEMLVLTHIDTVWPAGKIVKMPFYVSGNKLYGPGVLDMKAGVVMLLTALRSLNGLNVKPRKRITVVVNTAEETGHPAARDLIRKLARKASLVLCLEPALPGGALKLERKGRLVVRLDVHGRAAHGGSPEKGVSAIEELVAQIARLKRLRTGETTVNVGLMGGGEKANVVAENAWAILDVRFWKLADRDRVLKILREAVPVLRGARLKVSVESTTPPMEKTKASEKLFVRAQEIAVGMGLSLKGGKTGGGSDASIAAGMGIPTLDGLGPDGAGIHAENEHLLLSSFIERTALLTEFLKDL
ncbi:MAG: M20 family metallopeptidase [Candidatus Aminicenantes bacterium]|nr:M20 family metallopeptidase [Candidatus Aminicenantes bacterium]TFG52387.1 MAG: M20 family peptidase [Candidatus Aminicenantes bacterium]